MSWRGDRGVGDTVGGSFNSLVNGVATTLSGTPSINVYKRGSSSPSTAGCTLNVDVNSVTGLNSWVVDTSSDGAFYVAGDYTVCIAAGTVGGYSVIGTEIGSFSLALATANANQIAGSSTGATNLNKTTNAIGRGTVTTGGTTTSVPTSAFSPAGAVADQFKNRVILFDANTTTTALRGQAVTITASSNAATPTFTVSALTTAPSSGDTFSVI